jgi:ZIP family zinc transporter
MFAGIEKTSPVILAFIGTLFTWFITALGAAVIFLKQNINRKILDASLGFSAGIMIAASFFSLLLPSIEISGELGLPKWLAPTTGFLLGGFFLRILDKFIPHLHLTSLLKKQKA